MTDINRKSLFALFAVALMVLSVCAVIVVYENPTVADNTTVTDGVKISCDNSGTWNITEPSSPDGMSIESNELVLNGFRQEHTATNSSYYAIKIDGSATGQTKANLVINIKGENIINNNASSGSDFVIIGIAVKNTALTFKSDDNSSLTMNVVNNTSKSVGIGIIDNDNDTSTVNFVGSKNVNITSSNGESGDGIYTKGQVTFNNSKNVNINANGPMTNCVDCSKLSITNSTDITIRTSGGMNTAVQTDDFSISDSSFYCTAEDRTNSYAISTKNAPIKFSNSSTVFQGNTAILGDTTWNTSSFTGVITTASTDYNGGSPQTIIGEISSSYKYVKTTPGPTPVAYTVNYDINGGQGTAPPSQTYIVGNDGITLPDSSGFSKNGATFKGWSADDGKTVMKAGEKYKPTSNVTLKAIWEQNSSSGGNDNTTLIICVVLAIIILVGCGAYAYYKKFKQ